MESNYLFRCSKLSEIMVDPKTTKKIYLLDGTEITTKKYNQIIDLSVNTNDIEILKRISTKEVAVNETISETTKKYLTEVFINQRYGRWKDFENKYTQKGLLVEEEALTMYTLHKNKVFHKNDHRISNEFIIGEPDSFSGESILKADLVIDTKAKWDLFTFFETKRNGLIKSYYWQMQGYMALTGAKKAIIANCLVNTPNSIIQGLKASLARKMGLGFNEVSQDFLDAAEKIDKNAIFDDIPMKDRIHEIEILRNDADIKRLYERIELCRKWIKENLETVPEPIEIIGT
jgi:hypothetical protein